MADSVVPNADGAAAPRPRVDNGIRVDGDGGSEGPPPLVGAIFVETFDSQPDWTPTGQECGGHWPEKCPDSDIPPGWTWYRNAEKWSPATGFPNNAYGQRISGDVKRGPTGKSWIKSSESDHPAGEANYYSDSILQKVFDRDYDELFVSFWLFFQPGWKWVSSGNAELKLVRIAHFDGGDGVNPFQFGSGGATAPMFLLQLKQSTTWGWRAHYEPRCDRQEEHYFCGNETGYDPLFLCPAGVNCTGFEMSDGSVHPRFEESLGDGKWHQIELQVKMNSSVGAADGVLALWIDGIEQYRMDDIEWRYAGAPTSLGWNSVAFGGNWNNWFSAVQNQDELWYAIDDVVVSTQRIGAP